MYSLRIRENVKVIADKEENYVNCYHAVKPRCVLSGP